MSDRPSYSIGSRTVQRSRIRFSEWTLVIFRHLFMDVRKSVERGGCAGTAGQRTFRQVKRDLLTLSCNTIGKAGTLSDSQTKVFLSISCPVYIYWVTHGDWNTACSSTPLLAGRKRSELFVLGALKKMFMVGVKCVALTVCDQFLFFIIFRFPLD